MTKHQDEQGTEQAFGSQRLPGTGGDLQPTDLDVEGHRRVPVMATEETGPEGIRRILVSLDGEPDVEGHLYTGGPSTQGEFMRRVPENPHGD